MGMPEPLRWVGRVPMAGTGQKSFFNLPLLVLKARHLHVSGSAFCTGFSRLEVPLDGILLGLGLVVKTKPPEFSCD